MCVLVGLVCSMILLFKKPKADNSTTSFDKPFDKNTFDDVTSGAFFQKTTYQQAKNPIPGSFADEMIKM